MRPIRTRSCLSCCSAFRRLRRIFFISYVNIEPQQSKSPLFSFSTYLLRKLQRLEWNSVLVPWCLDWDRMLNVLANGRVLSSNLKLVHPEIEIVICLVG